jgi:hypothetical protein
MRCPRCDSDDPEGAEFFITRGTPVKPHSPQSGGATIPRAKHCGTCGTPLTAQTPAPPATPPLPPTRYPPGYLAEKILTSRPALEGERMQVTVLFADTKGSMGLPAARNPKEARQFLKMVS